jgi:hypothetical protein
MVRRVQTSVKPAESLSRLLASVSSAGNGIHNASNATLVRLSWGKRYWMAYLKDLTFPVVNCGPCNDIMSGSGKQGFVQVTLLEQYAYLLRVALVRLAAAVDTWGGSKPISLSGEASAGKESAVALLAQSSLSRQRPIYEERTRISNAKRISQFQIVGLYSHNVLCSSENVLMTHSRSRTLQVSLVSKTQGAL